MTGYVEGESILFCHHCGAKLVEIEVSVPKKRFDQHTGKPYSSYRRATICPAARHNWIRGLGTDHYIREESPRRAVIEKETE